MITCDPRVMAEVNALSADQFVDRFGFLFEHSPWIVATAAERRPFADAAAMEASLASVLQAATTDQRLTLIRAHPELAGKAAIDKTLTEASTQEQAAVGLDRLTPAEFDQFHALNDAYRARFGFPFIICVRLTDKVGILTQMQARLSHDRETEIAAACDEVGKIVHLRLAEALT